MSPLPSAASTSASWTAGARLRRASRRRLTVLGWLVLLEAAFLASTVLWQQHPLGLALAIALIAALIQAWWMAARALRGVHATWVLPPPPHAGATTELGAWLHSSPGAPPLLLRAYSPAGRRLETVARVPSLEGRGSRPDWTVRFPRRGLIHLPPLVAQTSQPFGMLAVSQAISAGTDILVLPGIGTLRRALRSRLSRWAEASNITPESGDDEIARLRDYRPGDPLARVHWKASARQRHLVVAERHAPGCRRIGLVVDTRVMSTEARRLERMICVAASLVEYLLGHGWTLSLHGAFAKVGVDGDRLRLLEALALAGPASGEEPVTDFIPPHRACIVLSLHPLPPMELHPAPFTLSLGECEQLVHLPRRLR